AQHIQPAELTELEALLEHIAQIVAAGESPVDADLASLHKVARAANNEALLLARAPVSRLMHAGYAAIAPKVPQSGARLLASHRQLLDALRRQHAEEAHAISLRHMDDYRRGCEAAGLDMQQKLP